MILLFLMQFDNIILMDNNILQHLCVRIEEIESQITNLTKAIQLIQNYNETQEQTYNDIQEQVKNLKAIVESNQSQSINTNLRLIDSKLSEVNNIKNRSQEKCYDQVVIKDLENDINEWIRKIELQFIVAYNIIDRI